MMPWCDSLSDNGVQRPNYALSLSRQDLSTAGRRAEFDQRQAAAMAVPNSPPAAPACPTHWTPSWRFALTPKPWPDRWRSRRRRRQGCSPPGGGWRGPRDHSRILLDATARASGCPANQCRPIAGEVGRPAAPAAVFHVKIRNRRTAARCDRTPNVAEAIGFDPWSLLRELTETSLG